MFQDADERRSVEKKLLERLRSTSTPAKEAAFAAFTRPRLSLDVIGGYAGKFGPAHFRIHGAWRGKPENAFVAVQGSTPDLTIGGDVSITTHPSEDWTRAVVQRFPTRPAAGRRQVDNAVPTSTQLMGESVVRTVIANASSTSAAAAFVHLKPVLGAVITVRVGALADGVTPGEAEIHVADIEDEGRYALVMDSPATALGVDAEGLARLINKVFNSVRDRRRRRVDAL
ncbi:hypothetical protein [uncultured Williamsia sp.]|uniref:hypothetical protein n=1 Tax=uncultured Williamsia sp. TaxID=259311 RepID=UPI00260A3157|nr:hypothetical protein [uncultured Williamsia sp.]